MHPPHQVDCVRRAAAASSGWGFLAEPMSLYTYDCDPETMLSPPSYGGPPSPSRAPGASGAAGAGAGDGTHRSWRW